MDPSSRSNRFAGPPAASNPSNAGYTSPSHYPSNLNATQEIQRSAAIPIPDSHQILNGHDYRSDNEHSSSSGRSNSSRSNRSSGRSSDSDLFHMEPELSRSPEPIQSITESDRERFRYTPPLPMRHVVLSRSRLCPDCNQAMREYEARTHAETCPRRRDRSSSYESSLPSREQFFNLSRTNASQQERITATQPAQLTNTRSLQATRSRVTNTLSSVYGQMYAPESHSAQDYRARTRRRYRGDSLPSPPGWSEPENVQSQSQVQSLSLPLSPSVPALPGQHNYGSGASLAIDTRNALASFSLESGPGTWDRSYNRPR